jgi:hypothetical protein
MRETAVKWLLENLISEPISEDDFKHNEKCWDEAEQMEKKQIIDAVYYNASSMTHDDLPAGESYYNRRFKL